MELKVIIILNIIATFLNGLCIAHYVRDLIRSNRQQRRRQLGDEEQDLEKLRPLQQQVSELGSYNATEKIEATCPEEKLYKDLEKQ